MEFFPAFQSLEALTSVIIFPYEFLYLNFFRATSVQMYLVSFSLFKIDISAADAPSPPSRNLFSSYAFLTFSTVRISEKSVGVSETILFVILIVLGACEHLNSAFSSFRFDISALRQFFGLLLRCRFKYRPDANAAEQNSQEKFGS